MGVTICASGVKRQLTEKRYGEVQVQEWCSKRIEAIDAFETDDSLKGKGWDAARRRMEDYASFFGCMRYGSEEVYRIDGKVHGLVGSYFGDKTVREDEWETQRGEALRHVNHYNILITLVGALPSDTTKLRKNLGSKRDAWNKKLQAAEAMLEKIRQYCAKTDNIYDGSLAGIEKALSKGAKQLGNTRYDAGSRTWGTIDNSWKQEMAKACDTGVTRGSDLFDKNGKLDEEMASRILHKPPELMTEGELVALSEAYERAAKEAVGGPDGKSQGDPSNLNAFLNCCYVVEGVETKVTGSGSDSPLVKTCTVATTYVMSVGAAAFLSLISDGYDKKAYEKLGNLDSWEYLAAGTATALVNNAQSFTVTEEITVGEEMKYARDTKKPEFNGKDDPSNKHVLDRDSTLGALENGGPNVTVEVGQTKTLGGRTVRYDDISFGERGTKRGNDVSADDLLFEEDPMGAKEKKHVYVFRDNGSAIDNINSQNLKDSIDNYEGKVEERDTYWRKEAVNRGKKAVVKQIKKVVQAEPHIKAASTVVETIYDTAKDISDTIEGYEETQKAVEDAYKGFEHQVDIADQSSYIQSSDADNGIVYWSPDTNKSGLSCVGYDEKNNGAGRRATYERNLQEYEAAKRGEGRANCYQRSFNDWMNGLE